jgi:23S rRNA pseudouridine1911/1915/1917 synthase
MTVETHTLIADEFDHGARLDKWITAALPQFSRSRIQALLAQGVVKNRAGQALTDAAYKLKAGDEITIEIPAVIESPMEAQAMALNVVFEDDCLIVINKPAGLTVHPGAGTPDGTLVNALLAYAGGSLSGIGGVARPGIVHRIDKDTSGLLVVAKTDAAHHHLSAQLSERTLKRQYLAVCHGMLAPQTRTITGNIGRAPMNRQKMAVLKTGGKEAVTHVSTLQVFHANDRPIASLVQANLETGRTHQIRVHMAHIGHALIGDPVYGNRKKSPVEAINDFPRQALHAHRLHLIHPVTEEEMEFEAPLPEDMEMLIESLK